MTAYYNEIDPHAAAWLRVLIQRGLVAPGDVDERSILEVKPDDLRSYTQCHFFAGIGGWSYALRLAGIPDDRSVWTGSCPCQPFSVAGKQRGSNDERHLWPAFFDLIRECGPASVFGEQVAGSAGLAWLDHVCSDLEDAGYAAAAADLCAAGAGAPHIRQRLYWVGKLADTESTGGRAHTGAVSSGTLAGLRNTQGGDIGRSQLEIRRLVDSGSNGALAHADGKQDHATVARGLHAELGSGGLAVALAHAESKRQRTDQPRTDRSAGLILEGPRTRGDCSDDGAACKLDDAQCSGLEGHGADLPTRRRERETGSAAAPGVLDAWADLAWIECSDGKARPTQRGIFPLAARLPKGMVRGSDPGAPLNADENSEARVMRLRGYGNAIVPQIAAMFVMASEATA